MWPWSTIRKLKNQVQFYKDIAAAEEKRCFDLVDEVSVLHTQLTDVRYQLSDAKAEADMWQKSRDNAWAKHDAMVIKLTEAQKNDSPRDTKTGRFTKRT